MSSLFSHPFVAKYGAWVLTVCAVGTLRWLYKCFTRYRLPFERYSLKDKVCVITGASQGVGRAIARRMFSDGARVVLLARSIDKMQELADEMRASFPHNTHEPIVRYIDMAEPNGVDDLIALLPDHRVDVLVNNAGIAVHASAARTSIETHRQTMQINYFSHIQLTQQLLPHMRDGGSIVVVGSVQGRFAIPHRSAYGASKHAIQAYFDSLRAELVGRIHVLCIQPGYIATNLSHNALTGDGARYGHDDERLSKGMTPEYVADASVNALIRGEHELFLAPLSPHLAHWLRFLTPNLYFYVMQRRALTDTDKED